MREFFLEAEDFDLEETLTCGQTFCWHRFEGSLYGEGGSSFYSFRNGKPVIVEDEGDEIRVETELGREEVEEMLGIHHDPREIVSGFENEEAVREAFREYSGLRIVQDEFLPCLVSYICSSQMRIPRIKEMFNEMADRWGEKVEHGGRELKKFPDLETLEQLDEEDFRDIGVGYRAEYLEKTLEMLSRGEVREEELREMSYSDAKEELMKLHGVGNKVADCVMLFSLGFHEATPLDTWARKAVKTHYPGLHSGGYEEMSENLRGRFGENTGYAVEYLFHAARDGAIEVEG